ncbi:MAG: undecaprenyl-diphosphate phosphatase [Xanthomonadales bacterium]|nr:undecaprenyl-diphosphate phosphatase [Xanthomonadales bacterium]
MSPLQVVVLALIQGLTEFLPVSSSAHLILGSWLLGWRDQGLVIDVAIHFGTLFAVLIYFHRDLREMLGAWKSDPGNPRAAGKRQLGLQILLASIPVLLAGAVLHTWVESSLRDVRVIAVSTIFFGLLLWLADAKFSRQRTIEDMRLRPALWIGLAQVAALIPGASRSGVTMTMGRMLGFSATASARFSFLLAIPVLAAAGAYGILRTLQDQASPDWGLFLLAVITSAGAGLVCIGGFLALLKRVGLVPFVIYRLGLGAVLVYLAF